MEKKTHVNFEINKTGQNFKDGQIKCFHDLVNIILKIEYLVNS